MKTLAALFAMMIVLNGCATTRVVKIEVPVPVPCKTVTAPVRPVLPEIPPTAKPEEQVGLLRQAIAKTMAYARELEEKLKPYEKPR